jgi:hypothetical protein
VEAVMRVCTAPKNKHRLTLRAGTEPKLALKLRSGEDTLQSALDLIEDLRVNRESKEK